MVAILISLVTKLFWWLLPHLVQYISKYCDEVLTLVLAYEGSQTQPDLRRTIVLQTLAQDFPMLPEFVNRAAVEVALLFVRCGVTQETLEKAKLAVSAINYSELSDAEKRQQVLETLKAKFSTLPDRVLRLLIELSVARIKGEKGA